MSFSLKRALLHGSEKPIKLCPSSLKVILCIHPKSKIGDDYMACKTKKPKKKHLKSSKYRVRNWPEYDKGLKQRGRILIWVDPRCDWLYQGLRKPGEKVDVAVADGAYDTADVYATFISENKDATIIIPPRKSAVLSDDILFSQRNNHIEYIQNNGRDEWEKRSGYSKQARSENTMFRYKTTFGDKLHARLFESQKNEAMLSCSILNKMASLGMPNSYKVA